MKEGPRWQGFSVYPAFLAHPFDFQTVALVEVGIVPLIVGTDPVIVPIVPGFAAVRREVDVDPVIVPIVPGFAAVRREVGVDPVVVPIVLGFADARREVGTDPVIVLFVPGFADARREAGNIFLTSRHTPLLL